MRLELLVAGALAAGCSPRHRFAPVNPATLDAGSMRVRLDHVDAHPSGSAVVIGVHVENDREVEFRGDLAKLEVGGVRYAQEDEARSSGQQTSGTTDVLFAVAGVIIDAYRISPARCTATPACDATLRFVVPPDQLAHPETIRLVLEGSSAPPLEIIRADRAGRLEPVSSRLVFIGLGLGAGINVHQSQTDVAFAFEVSAGWRRGPVGLAGVLILGEPSGAAVDLRYAHLFGRWGIEPFAGYGVFQLIKSGHDGHGPRMGCSFLRTDRVSLFGSNVISGAMGVFVELIAPELTDGRAWIGQLGIAATQF